MLPLKNATFKKKKRPDFISTTAVQYEEVSYPHVLEQMLGIIDPSAQKESSKIHKKASGEMK